jgi:hypothetical protein
MIKKWKGTKGTNRNKYSALLADKALAGDQAAKQTVIILISKRLWDEFGTKERRDCLVVLLCRTLESWRGSV